MYNLNQLQTFVRVAEKGSFNKVAEEEYMSPSAVMKQVDNLEADLGGVKLFDRSKRGNTLTEIGEFFYKEAKNVIAFCEESKKRVIQKAKTEESTVRIAVTHSFFVEQVEVLWEELHKNYPEIHLTYVPYTYDTKEAVKLWGDYENWTDIAIGIIADGFDSEEYDSIALYKLPLTCVMSNIHRLAKSDYINPEDLAGECVYSLSDDEYSGRMKRINQHLRKVAKDIDLELKDAYDYSIYNECLNSNSIMLSVAQDVSAHPFMKSVPLKWESQFSYGIIYRRNHSKSVEDFIEAIKVIMRGNNINI